jgi:hypothetical protein
MKAEDHFISKAELGKLMRRVLQSDLTQSQVHSPSRSDVTSSSTFFFLLPGTVPARCTRSARIGA